MQKLYTSLPFLVVSKIYLVHFMWKVIYMCIIYFELKKNVKHIEIKFRHQNDQKKTLAFRWKIYPQNNKKEEKVYLGFFL